ncbi:MAG: DUF4258 domain-containing protein [Candidatus Sumerlaeota bacterium]|nr:DUF4258 domain-containing protein [Candidatus Sumerlaeota bacterium]
MEIEDIRPCVRAKDYRVSDHAVKRMMRRSIERVEFEEALMEGEIIEQYRGDKYSPSCLIYGKTRRGRDLHVQVSLPPRVVIITAYDPDPAEWIGCRVRRHKR